MKDNDKIIIKKQIITFERRRKNSLKDKYFIILFFIVSLILISNFKYSIFRTNINIIKNKNKKVAIYKLNETKLNLSNSEDIFKESNKLPANNNNSIVNSNNFQYFCCFCVMGKMENRYTRELISYYLNIGVDKFVIADKNLPKTEKFTDVVKDYIDNGTVDYIDIIGQFYEYAEYYDIMYQKYKNKCEWVTFFDFDEYLVLYSEKGKKIGLKEFLSNTKFDKCEAIEFNWLLYGDNDLVYYDNRTSIKRFTKPDYKNSYNRFVKSMIRGGLNKTAFFPKQSIHKPDMNISTCSPDGEIPTLFSYDCLSPPNFKYGYLMHFNTRTAEEYVGKITRGYAGNRYEPFDQRINLFFIHNKFTQEKLKVFEKLLNQTFSRYHDKSND